MIGGILLAFTGCEALFADLGAFSKRFILFFPTCSLDRSQFEY